MWCGHVTVPERIDIIDARMPVARQPCELLVRTLVGGICGSDLPYFVDATTVDGEPPGFGVPLHEIVGVVETSADPTLPAGTTVVGWARDNNGLAEFVVTGADDVVPVTRMTAQHAIVAQPLACAMAAVDRLAPACVGKHVAVLGLGPMGLLFAEVAAAHGAARVTGVDPIRRIDDPSAFGVDEHIETSAEEWAAALSDGDRPAIVIEAVGHDLATVSAAVDAAAPWSHVYFFGVPLTGPYPIDMMSLLRKQLTVYSGTTALDRPRYLTAALRYLARRPQCAERLVTDVFDHEAVQEAFDCASARPVGHAKVLVQMAQN